VNVEDRIRKLRKSGKLPCRICGYRPDEKPKCSVSWTKPGEDPGKTHFERCPECGRTVCAKVVLTWADIG
jgi:hypothetical protein